MHVQNSNYESVYEISQFHHRYINIIVALKRSTNALDMLMNRLKNIEKFIDTFDPLGDERLLLDENFNSVKTIYKDFQAKLSDLMEVISAQQFLERAANVEQFDLLYTKTIVA
jgi:CII-binding regulator of phage lambda lysogenization HflD